jgi:hypothetical protein
MDKVEAYLDRVCRGIAGPRALRAHVRQELREHLEDAAARHVAAGMPEDEAMDLALEEFGGPDEVRAELEATHGHRWMTVVIDQAMAWKERTMRARWLWTTWAHAGLLLTIAVELLTVAGVVIFLLPKYREVVTFWRAYTLGIEPPIIPWSIHYMDRVALVCSYWPWVAAAVAAGWVVFERGVKGENKALIRLAKLGSVAVALGVAVMLMMLAMVIPFLILVPTPAGMMRVADHEMERVGRDVRDMAAEAARENWAAVARNAQDADESLARLHGAQMYVFLQCEVPVADREAALAAAREALARVEQEAARGPGGVRREVLATALREFDDTFTKVRRSATRPEGAR